MRNFATLTALICALTFGLGTTGCTKTPGKKKAEPDKSETKPATKPQKKADLKAKQKKEKAELTVEQKKEQVKLKAEQMKELNELVATQKASKLTLKQKKKALGKLFAKQGKEWVNLEAKQVKKRVELAAKEEKELKELVAKQKKKLAEFSVKPCPEGCTKVVKTKKRTHKRRYRRAAVKRRAPRIGIRPPVIYPSHRTATGNPTAYDLVQDDRTAKLGVRVTKVEKGLSLAEQAIEINNDFRRRTLLVPKKVEAESQ